LKNHRFDYIILGQGLAGTCLALDLLKCNKKVLIIDNDYKESASRVAAGVFNPVTGRRIVTTWRANEIFDYIPDYYKSLEEEVGKKLFWMRPVYRAFQNLTEQNEWLSKPRYELPVFVREIFTKPQFQAFISDPIGGIEFQGGGYLDVENFLGEMRKRFEEQEAFVKAQVNLGDIVWQSPFKVMGYEAEKLILCMGFRGCANTPFGEEPFRPVKGELIEINTDTLLPETILNGPVIVIRQNNSVKVGATYDFNDTTWEPTKKGLTILKERLDSFLKIPYTIESHLAGIRPSSVDRRPVAGEHPHIKYLGILNGLGTKGVSLAPFISKLLVDYFENGKELDREIDIKRFFE